MPDDHSTEAVWPVVRGTIVVTAMKPVAIFRFSPTEGPGHFGDWLDSQYIAWKVIELDRGEAVPADSRAFAGVGMAAAAGIAGHFVDVRRLA